MKKKQEKMKGREMDGRDERKKRGSGRGEKGNQEIK